MQAITLSPQPRETGKRATKAVRKAGLVPCVLYGSHTEPVHFAVDTLQIRPLVYTTETYRVELALGGEEHQAIVKEVVFHPVTEQPIHADFLALTAGEALTMVIPIRLEGTPVGVKGGGVLSQPLQELEIRALPKDIPGHISVDVSGLAVGESVHVGEIGLGEAVEVVTDPDQTVAVVSAPRALVEEDTAEEAVTDLLGGEAIEGEAPEGEDEAGAPDAETE